MNAVGMGVAGLNLALLLVLWLGSVSVSSYEDLRGTPCRNKTTYAAVPPERTQWLGSVQLTIQCDQGYDLPLNAPQNSILTCFPNGSTWQPDYLPDCNDKIIAKVAEMAMIGHLSKAKCSSLGKLTTSRTSLTFGPSRQVIITQKCKESGLEGCVVIHASIDCQDKAGGPSPHIFMTTRFPMAASTAWSKYKTGSVTLGLSILRDLEASAQSSHVNVSIQPLCQPGTVGVLRAGVEVVCRGCSLGHYLDSTQKKCLPCSPGYYGDMILSTSCKLCPGMSSYANSPQWKSITASVPNRAHAISSCPILFEHENGTLEVRLPSGINAQLTRVEKGKDQPEPRDPKNGDQPSLGLGSILTLAGFFLASVYVA